MPLAMLGQDAGCTTDMVAGHYGLIHDTWTLSPGGPLPFEPRVGLHVMEADGAGGVPFARALLNSVPGSETDDEGNLIDDGNLLIDLHDVFDSITYEVFADCRVIIRYTLNGELLSENAGVVVDGGRMIIGINHHDNDDASISVGEFVMHRIDSATDTIESRLAAIEAQTAETNNLVKRIARRLSLNVE